MNKRRLISAAVCMVSTIGLVSAASAQDSGVDGWVEEPSDWIERHAPEAGTFELGFYGGLMSPSERLELFNIDFDRPDAGFQAYEGTAPDIGLRLGYYPLSWLGAELEGGVMPASTAAGDATLWTTRAHAIFQLPYWRIVPFATVGGGMINVSSDDDVVGNDFDPLFHFGVGAKFYFNDWAHLRVDARNNVSPIALGPGATNSLEFLASFALTFGRAESAPIASKEPVVEPKPEPKPEPAKPVDTDGDGIFDGDDKCVDQPETVNQIEDEDGCPEVDSDGDGVLDPVDTCPDQPGPREGCPIPDTDGDGINDEQDKCINEPETANGFEDADGCPDELPKEVKEFTGTIRGIQFATGSSKITANSRSTLDEAAKTLRAYPKLNVLIVGHTDDQGERAKNMELSANRAAQVKAYLVSKGVGASRIQTKGVGPDEPLVDNDTEANRAKNRRIEFRLVNK